MPIKENSNSDPRVFTLATALLESGAGKGSYFGSGTAKSKGSYFGSGTAKSKEKSRESDQ